MENEPGESTRDLADDLCHLYQEQERMKALNYDICGLMLSSGDQSPREWVKVRDSHSERQTR